jgi:hypothetical protein
MPSQNESVLSIWMNGTAFSGVPSTPSTASIPKEKSASPRNADTMNRVWAAAHHAPLPRGTTASVSLAQRTASAKRLANQAACAAVCTTDGRSASSGPSATARSA